MENLGIFLILILQLKWVMAGNSLELKSFSHAEELAGKLSSQDVEDKLMHSVLDNDKKTIEEGKLIKDSINQGISSFTPDMMFEQLCKSYSMAKEIFGESLLKLLSGYDPDYIRRNIHIPEFQRELKKRIDERINELKGRSLIDENYNFTEKGITLASLVLYREELDNIIPKGILGERIHKKSSTYGDAKDARQFRRSDRYRDLALKSSIKLAIRRKHRSLTEHDLKTSERQSRGSICIMYALDASGSMKGKKIDMCKKAGVALAYKAIEEKNKVGLIVFGTEIKQAISPTDDFGLLLREITKIKASKETNITNTIEKAVELFPAKDITKHLVLLTDAQPTIGKNPEEEALEACSKAKSNKITISVIGISMDKKGESLAKKIVEIGEGRLYVCKDLEELDKIVLQDYYELG